MDVQLTKVRGFLGNIDAEKQAMFLKLVILSGAMLLAFSVRLFSVLRYESVIHEFDPYFNYRTTQYLVEEGFYNFHNWFDDRAWYPLGRIIGGTIYPGNLEFSSFEIRDCCFNDHKLKSGYFLGVLLFYIALILAKYSVFLSIFICIPFCEKLNSLFEKKSRNKILRFS